MKMNLTSFDKGFLVGMVTVAVLALAPLVALATPTSTQLTFSTPKDGVIELLEAVQGNDQSKLAEIFGKDAKELLSSGDAVKDREGRAEFFALADQRTEIDLLTPSSAVLLVGDEEWPFPIPLVKDGSMWRFDTAQGEQEIIDRRIGQNEINTMKTLRGVVEAQKEYFALKINGTSQFAKVFVSTPGLRNGLFWARKPGEPLSPLGPIFIEAQDAGYSTGEEVKQAYHGYRYKILTRQGAAAPGGKLSYLDSKGEMVKGFAVLAYPTVWGSSGIMSFMVGQDGYIYQTDLGTDTLKIAQQISEFNPTKEWTVAATPHGG